MRSYTSSSALIDILVAPCHKSRAGDDDRDSSSACKDFCISLQTSYL